MIWLVGNGGMLGSDVEDVLQEAEFDFLATDIEVDITDYNELERFSREHRIEWIINCSGYTAVDRAEEEPEKAFTINADGALNIAKIARERGARLLHISTDYVFDGQKEGEYKEDDPPNPIGVYGKSKLEGERHILRTLREYFIIRTAWLYGRHGSNFVYSMLRLFKEKSSVRVVNDQWGSPTYAKDLARAIMKIIESKGDRYGVYHYTNEGKITWYRFAREIYKKAKEYRLVEKEVDILSIITDEYPTKAKRPKNSSMSKKKIKDTFRLNIREYKEALDEFLKDVDEKHFSKKGL